MVLVAAAAALVLLLGAWWRWRRDWRIPASEYAAYISSAAWSRRKRRWRRALRFVVMPWRRWCRVCLARQVAIHHRRYKRLGHEFHRDLVPLCDTHHHELHAIGRRNGWSVEHASDVYLSRTRVWLLSSAPVILLAVVGLGVATQLR